MCIVRLPKRLVLVVTMLLISVFLSNPRPAKPSVAVAGGMNGHADRRVHDAEEFELEGLISDDDDGEDKRE